MVLFDLRDFAIVRGDGYHYLEIGKNLGNSSNENLYLGYILFVYLFVALGDSTLLIIMQCILVMSAAHALFSISKQYGGIFAGYLAIAFYLLNPLLAQWTRYVLTESSYFALTIIVLRIATYSSNKLHLLLLPGIVAVTFWRPNGIVMACSLMSIFLIYRSIRWQKKLVSIIATWTFGVLFASQHFTKDEKSSLFKYPIFENTLKGTVIFDAEQMNLQMPVFQGNDNSYSSLVKYLTEHPIETTKLVLLRICWELIQVRPWYSFSLNLFITILMSVFILMSLFGFFSLRGSEISKAVVLTTLPSAGFIGFTWAIWEGRFGWWFLVTWIPLFSAGTSQFIFYAFRRYEFLSKRLFKIKLIKT